MKKVLMMVLSVSIVIGISITGAYAGSSVRVKTYKKKDGTVVQSHRKTSPDKSKRDNFSTKGNINPYTGKEGTKDPYKTEKKKKK